MDPIITILVSVMSALFGWVGFSITAVLRGWVIPRATHLLQIELLKTLVESKTEESKEWRSTAEIERLGKQEAMAQLRLALETNQSFARDFSDFRAGVEQVREANDDGR